MKEYQVVVEHTPDECLRTLDEIADYNPDLLGRFWFTCAEGAHEGTAILEASSEAEALEQIPPALRSDADVTPVRRYTMHSVKALHRMAAA